MSNYSELEKAQKLENEGKSLEAAIIYQQIGTKYLREGSQSEQKDAPKLIAKSIARYLLADELEKAQDLAFQSLFMKDSDPFLSLQIESAITAKSQLVRGILIKELPDEITEKHELFIKIPQTRKLLQINKEVTIKKTWEGTLFGIFEKKYDLIEQKFQNSREMINFLLSTRTGLIIIGAEIITGEKMLILIAVTFNKNPVEILEL